MLTLDPSQPEVPNLTADAMLALDPYAAHPGISIPGVPRRILYVNRDLEMQSPKDVAKFLQVVTFACTSAADVLFDCAKDGHEALQLLATVKYSGIIMYANIAAMSALHCLEIAYEINHGDLGSVALIGRPCGTLTAEQARIVTVVFDDDDVAPFTGENLVSVLKLLVDGEDERASGAPYAPPSAPASSLPSYV